MCPVVRNGNGRRQVRTVSCIIYYVWLKLLLDGEATHSSHQNSLSFEFKFYMLCATTNFRWYILLPNARRVS